MKRDMRKTSFSPLLLVPDADPTGQTGMVVDARGDGGGGGVGGAVIPSPAGSPYAQRRKLTVGLMPPAPAPKMGAKRKISHFQVSMEGTRFDTVYPIQRKCYYTYYISYTVFDRFIS